MQDSLITSVATIRRLKALQHQDFARVHGRSRRVASLTRKVRAALEGGATTGDSLRDIVIQAEGVDEELVLKFRKLQDEIARKNKGELVFICYRIENPQTAFPTRQQLEFSTTALFRVALLSGDTLRLEERSIPRIGIPIEGYVQGTWPQSSKFLPSIDKDELPVQKGLFDWVVSSIRDQPPPITAFLDPSRKEKKWHRLIIGTEEVRAAFNKVKGKAVLDLAVQKLHAVKV